MDKLYLSLYDRIAGTIIQEFPVEGITVSQINTHEEAGPITVSTERELTEEEKDTMRNAVGRALLRFDTL